VGLAHRAGDSITSIRASANQVARAVDDIAIALREQGNAAQLIATNIERIARCPKKTAPPPPAPPNPPNACGTWLPSSRPPSPSSRSEGTGSGNYRGTATSLMRAVMMAWRRSRPRAARWVS